MTTHFDPDAEVAAILRRLTVAEQLAWIEFGRLIIATRSQPDCMQKATATA